MKRVLFIDDDEKLIKSYRRIFSRMDDKNTQFYFETDTLRAVDLIRQENWDYIFCDFLMPDVQGDVILKQAFEIGSKAVKTIITGVSEIEIDPEYIDYKLEKPCNIDDISRIIGDKIEP